MLFPDQVSQNSETEPVPKIYQILGFNTIPKNILELPQEMQIITIIRQGFSIISVIKVAEYCGLSESQMAALLATSERTISRRKKDQKPLDLSESDRLYRIARIVAHTLDIFESVETARDWLKKSNRALAGKTPLELLDTDAGTQQVDEVLNKIEYGIYC
ncbi:MAG: antitoxin Xre/MbcA/ParS toxin-binding domain-containing protein [Trichodesmium sp.]